MLTISCDYFLAVTSDFLESPLVARQEWYSTWTDCFPPPVFVPSYYKLTSSFISTVQTWECTIFSFKTLGKKGAYAFFLKYQTIPLSMAWLALSTFSHHAAEDILNSKDKTVFEQAVGVSLDHELRWSPLKGYILLPGLLTPASITLHVFNTRGRSTTIIWPKCLSGFRCTRALTLKKAQGWDVSVNQCQAL